ncbi:MAG: glycosyltransferase [bacterium]|nr:glycosyltransferase [bacterium]
MATELRIALVHDWLTNLGGAERVLLLMHQAFPKAPIYTSIFNPKKLPEFAKLNVRTSFLQKFPLAKKKHQLYPTLRRLAFESFDFSKFDIVISSSSAEAKGIITSTETFHISYINTPTRYYWSGYNEYLKSPGYGVFNPFVRLIMPRLVKKMRRWDYAAAQRPDIIIANSENVKKRIKKYYNRDSLVLHPPVDLSRFKPDKDEGYYLVVSRLIPYKRIDLAVKACSNLNKKLVVIGSGSEYKKLKSMSNSNVHFTGALTDREINNYYKNALAFIFTAEEDFGITPLEAMASGKPVICYGAGGAKETVIDNETGIYFEKQNEQSLQNAIKKFEKMEFNQNKIIDRAEQFSEDNFIKKLKEVIEVNYEEFIKT